MHPFHRKHNNQVNAANRNNSYGRKQHLERDERGEAMDGFDRYEYTQQSTHVYKEKVQSPLKDKQDVLLQAIKDKDAIAVEELDPVEDSGDVASDHASPETNNNNDPKRNLLSCFKSNSSSEQEDPLAGFHSLEKQVWNDLVKLLVGPDRKTPIHWINQSFIFSIPKLKYAFLQYKGGCCGILAPVQAYLIKVLLFSGNNGSPPEPLRPSETQAKQALVQALTDMLWQAGKHKAKLAITSVLSVKSLEEVGENIIVKEFSDKKYLRESISENLDYFTLPVSAGCLLFVISAVLSRGITNVASDMDEESWPLIGSNDFCSLEILNLLLSGLAVSNVFDNSVQVDSCTLRGVPTRADIGFLSLYEHYNSCQVGSNLKTPRFPIWVVNCENHFTVLFSCNKDLVSDWRAERIFHLYHYDGYHTANEEIKLTLDTRGLEDQVQKPNDTVPPLEHCIRTKWKGASITWNVNQHNAISN